MYIQSASLSEFYKKVREETPALKRLRLLFGKTELREDSTTLQLQSIGVQHGSSIFGVIRTDGGSDPCIQLLQACSNKSISGVTTPSTRSCDHCGALVQHVEASKQIKCPASSKELHLICLWEKDPEGNKCGNCKAAPSIPRAS